MRESVESMKHRHKHTGSVPEAEASTASSEIISREEHPHAHGIFFVSASTSSELQGSCGYEQ